MFMYSIIYSTIYRLKSLFYRNHIRQIANMLQFASVVSPCSLGISWLSFIDVLLSLKALRYNTILLILFTILEFWGLEVQMENECKRIS